VEFFAATIRNKNTRPAWPVTGPPRTSSPGSMPPLQERMAKPTVKQHLAAIRMLFDWLVTGGILATNPATSVRGPKHVIKCGKTPVLTTDQARLLIESIDTLSF
jgi:integrase/recombinase XerD